MRCTPSRTPRNLSRRTANKFRRLCTLLAFLWFAPFSVSDWPDRPSGVGPTRDGTCGSARKVTIAADASRTQAHIRASAGSCPRPVLKIVILTTPVPIALSGFTWPRHPRGVRLWRIATPRTGGPRCNAVVARSERPAPIKGGSGAAPSADDGIVVTGPCDDAGMNYAARVLLFPDRATDAFLADFVATNPVSVGAAAAALLPELSTDVVRISR